MVECKSEKSSLYFPLRPAFTPTTKLIKCEGHGGNPSSIAKAKVISLGKPKPTYIFQA